MSIWGPGLYQNDVSDDVKRFFNDQLHRGKSADQITRELMESFREEITDSDDRPNFWLALADVQWDMGRLLPEVRAQALACLSDGSSIYPWEEEDKENVAKRRQVLEKLSEKLNMPQPPEKKVSLYRLYQCPWKVGDVFAFPLESEQAQALGLMDGWILLEKVGERKWHPGHRVPEMYAKLFAGSAFPGTIDEYEHLEYIKQSSHWRDLSLFSIPDPSDQSHFANIIRSIDENGYQTVYRFKIITTSKRSLPKDLVYVGNFAGAKHPAMEYVSQFDAEILAYRWTQLEEKILWCYNRYHTSSKP